MKRIILFILTALAAVSFWTDAGAQIYSTQDTIQIADSYGNPGDTVDVFFRMVNTTVTVAGVFHRIVFDDALINPVSIECLGRGCNMPFLGYDFNTPGVATFALYNLDGNTFIPRGDGDIVKMSFEIDQFASPGSQTLIEFQDNLQNLNGWGDSIPENPLLIIPVMVPGNFQVGGGPQNLPPVIGFIGTQEIPEGQLLQFNVQAHDVNADPITLAANNLPPNATFPQVQGDSLVTGTFTFRPDFDQGPDTFTVTFSAADNHNNVTNRDVDIIVLDQPNNYLRIISDQGGIRGAVNRPVDVNLFSTEAIFGSQFEINYDPTQVAVNEVRSTYRCVNMWFNYNEPDPGRIVVVVFSVGSDTIAAGDGPLVELVANVVSDATFGPTPIGLANATEVIDSVGTSKSLITEDGFFTVDPFGDANIDGLVTVGDCVSIVAFIIGRQEFTQRQFEAADIDTSGWVDIGDLQNIINVILEITTPRRVYPPDNPRVRVELLAEQPTYEEILDIPVEADILEEISGLQFKVEYNSQKLTGLEVVKGDIVSGLNLDYTISDGEINGVLFNLAGGSIGPIDGNLLNLSFQNNGAIFDPYSDIRLTEVKVVDPAAAFMPVEIIDNLPQSYTLAQNYPNPFNASTNIKFELKSSGHVELSIFDLLGRNVATLLNKDLQAGSHIVTWNGLAGDGSKMATGVYFYSLKAADFNETKKMVLVK